MSERKVCFVIAPIGERESTIRKRSDQVLKHIIRPAVEPLGYDAIRADEIDRPGLITSQVIQHVVNDPLVVADLTGLNPNVFYELAIRHAIRRPLVQLIQKGEAVPFDVAGTRVITVDHHDLDSVDAARAEIASQVRAMENDTSDLETPISVSLDLQILRQSENPEDRSLAEVLEVVSEVRSNLSKLDSRLNVPQLSAQLSSVRRDLKKLSTELLDPDATDVYTGRKRMPLSLVHEAVRQNSRATRDPIGVLIIASMVRDELPWLFELGLDAYRKARFRFSDVGKRALRDFRNRFRFAASSYMVRERFSARGEDSYYFETLASMLDEVLEPYLESPISARDTENDLDP